MLWVNAVFSEHLFDLIVIFHLELANSKDVWYGNCHLFGRRLDEFGVFEPCNKRGMGDRQFDLT